MNPYIIFNGVSSEDVGVIVEQLPDFHRAQRRVTETAIPGRHGALVTDEGAYELNSATLRINCNGVPLRTVYRWLRGEGWMVSSDAPEYKVYAYCYNSVTDSRFRLADGACYDSLSINLRIEPYLRLVDEEALEWTDAGGVIAATFAGQGDDTAAPLIAVTAGSPVYLIVNGSEIYIGQFTSAEDMAQEITRGTVVIDSEAGLVYRLDDEAGMVYWGEHIWYEEDDWPALAGQGGVNLISTALGLNYGDTEVTVRIEPHWRYL